MKKNKNLSDNRPINKMGPELNFASAEAYNYLRTNLSFSFPNKDGCKLIGLTSSNPAEGKSYTSVNLAYSIAESGQKVLLIDCDLRKPSLHRMLPYTNTKGLSNFLAENNVRIIQNRIMSENLSIITSGDIPPNPSELIGSNKMKSVLQSLSKSYDYIIVDLPPVNSVSDPLVVSKWLDGIILVVRHKEAKTSEVMNAVKQLQYVNAHIIGFVYNGYRTTDKAYTKGKYYYSSSSSSSSHSAASSSSAPRTASNNASGEDSSFDVFE